MSTLPIEARRRFRTTNRFHAFRFDEISYRDGEDEFGDDGLVIEFDREIFADPAAWANRRWKGNEIISFFLGDSRFYASRKDFNESTEPLNN